MRTSGLCCALAAAILALPVFAAYDGPPQTAVRVSRPPVLDGDLGDEAWAQAAPFTAFRMVFPDPGNAPSERTELRIVFDDEALFIGVRCLDREPSRISANTMAHDTSNEETVEDEVRVLLDPFQDRRNAYVFFVNAAGGRSEGLASGEHASLNWDGIWDSRSRRGPEGWACEIRIPFKTISFKPGLAAWGINVERYIARKQETIRLSGAARNSFFFNPVEAAPLEGIGSVKQGKGVTFRPYGLASVDRDPAAGTGTAWKVDGGFDLYKSFTPNLIGAVSYNTDFAETEVDDRRINLTRFPLYFPEKRAFFLEGSEIFDFGSAGESFSPFFSRRIGLYGESRVPIAFGTKVFGKLGDTSLSVLDVGTRPLADPRLGLDLAAENLFAARVYQNILDESKVGFIVTNGSPDGRRNTLAGLDLTYKTSRFLGDKNVLVSGWYARSWNEAAEGRHSAFGGKIDYPNDLFDIRAIYASYGDAFDPGLGFLERGGVQNLSTGFSFQPRPAKGGFVGDLIRQFFFELEGDLYWDLRGKLETRALGFGPLNFRTESGEHVEFRIDSKRDVLPYDFEVSPGVVLPKGSYDFVNYQAELNTASFRPWTASLEWRFGQFYSGHYDDAQVGFGLRVKGYASLAVNAELVRGRLPQGRFQQNLYRIKADLFLSPDLGLMNYIQYDDVSRTLGANIRFRWRLSPGNELFLVYTKNWERRWDPVARFVPLGERGVFKVTLSIRP